MVKQSCLCGKLILASEHSAARHSGVVNYQECLCPDCRSEFEQFVRVICIGCKSLQALQKPHRAKTGFVFEPRVHVHVEYCTTCRPEATHAPALEHLRFCRAKGIPTNADADIVQEVEQKSLQGKAEASKMRIELQDTFPTS